MKKVLLTIWLVVGSLAILGAVVAVAGWGMRLYRVQPTKVVAGTQVGSYAVCNGVVSQYNKIVSTLTSTASDIQKVNDQAAAVAKQVEAMNGYQQDPTCLAIVFNAAVTANDAATAKSAVDKIATLADQGRFIDNQLVGVTSVSQMQLQVSAMGNSLVGTG